MNEPSEVRLRLIDGTRIGIIPMHFAKQMANEQNGDLIEWDTSTRPTTYRIMPKNMTQTVSQS